MNKAKQLLADAGASNLTITLYAQQALEVPAIATVWQQQMKAIGVTVNIQTEPPDVYYGDGDGSWLKVDFGITEWGARATPSGVLQRRLRHRRRLQRVALERRRVRRHRGPDQQRARPRPSASRSTSRPSRSSSTAGR